MSMFAEFVKTAKSAKAAKNNKKKLFVLAKFQLKILVLVCIILVISLKKKFNK